MFFGRHLWAVCFFGGLILQKVRANPCDEPQFVFSSSNPNMNVHPASCATNEKAQLVSISLYALYGTASFDTNYAFGEKSFTNDPSGSYRREFKISASESPVCRCQSDFRVLLLPSSRTCAEFSPALSLSATCVNGSCRYGYRAEFKCVASNNSACQAVDVSNCDAYLTTTNVPSNTDITTTIAVNAIVIVVLGVLGGIALILIVAYSVKTYVRYRNVKEIVFEDSEDDVQMLSLASPDIVLNGHEDDEEDNVWRGPGSSLVLPVPLFDHHHPTPQPQPQPLFANGAFAQQQQHDQHDQHNQYDQHNQHDHHDERTAIVSAAAPDLIDPITGNRLELTSPPGINSPRFDSNTGLPLN